jgi:DNA-binding MarR family transcriptional regulator/N-acetylglutamate synthase-like GNAT family acetyltransferase
MPESRATGRVTSADADARVGVVRRFNRFYTRRIGVLDERHLRSPFSLAEVRVLYELAHRENTTASELGRVLGLDAGYLSRILRAFEKRGLLTRAPSTADARQSLLRLKKAGRDAFASLDARASAEVAAMVGALSDVEQRRVVSAMRTIEELLGGQLAERPPYVLRAHQPGDMGWVVHRHGALYAQEYGFDETFEALCAEIVAEFIRNLDPKRERCWIAERDGEILGSVFLVQKSKTVSKLRLLLVEPSARGMGIGGRLVSECVRFARQAGYKTMTLWTQSILYAARHIYVSAGFRLVREESHHSFGHDLVAETWEMAL